MGADVSIRAFIAAPLPQELLDSAARVQNGLKASRADAKWVSAENFHFTLKFLGEVATDLVEAVADGIASALEGEKPFDAALRGAGAFPKPERPRVIWIGMREGHDRLAALAEKIEIAMEGLGFPRERRPFSAHLTLGRLRSEKGSRELAAAIRAAENTEVGAFRVEKIILMRSDLRPTGPIYTPIREFPLGAASSV